MNYIVTHGNGHAAALDLGSSPKGFDLQGALAHACQLLSEGKPNVAIQDGNGNSISGDDLVACCAGTKILSADLRVISK
jgi:hypothetical protein